MLRDIVSYEWPYPHFISERALPEATLSEVRELFRTALPWETREGEFIAPIGSISEITSALEAATGSCRGSSSRPFGRA